MCQRYDRLGAKVKLIFKRWLICSYRLAYYRVTFDRVEELEKLVLSGNLIVSIHYDYKPN